MAARPKKPTQQAASSGLDVVESYWPCLQDLRDGLETFLAHFMHNAAVWRHTADLHPLWEFQASFSMVTPQATITDTGQAYALTVELPGLRACDIQVSVRSDILTIVGDRCEESRQDREAEHRSEHHHAGLRQSYRLPGGIDLTKIETDFTESTLTVVVRKQGARPRRRKQS